MSKKRASEVGAGTGTEPGTKPSTVDRLVDLRKNVGHGHVMSELLDILIDANDGDSEAVRKEIDESSATAAEVEAPNPEPPPAE